MRRAYLFAFAIVLLFPLTLTPAHAQAIWTFVSGTATSNATCSRTSPCQTLQAGVDAAESGGTVMCLDDLSTGAVSITKSITIDCNGTASTATANTGFPGIKVNGPGISVVIRNLSITNANGTDGIQVLQGASLHVENVRIFRQNAAPPDGYGIAVTPGTPFNLYVTDSIITNNGTGGINIAPISGGSVRATLRRVQLDDNFNGLNVDNTATSATTRVIVSDSSMTGNSNNGINLATSGPVVMTVERSAVSNNLRGIKSLGATATVRITNSTITGNGAGVQNLGGVMTSYKNNVINDNGQNGTPLAAATDD